MAIALSFLSLGPRVQVRDGVLRARTSILGALLTLGLHLKHFSVDPRERVLRVRSRVLWLIAWTREIPFDDIEEITYRYGNLTPLHQLRAEDATDCYTVGLRLKDRNDVDLFRWAGAGEFDNQSFYPDWCYWPETLVDFTGTQKDQSLAFYEALKAAVFPRGGARSAHQEEHAAFQRNYGGGTQAGWAQPAAPPMRPKPRVRPAPPPQ